MQDILVFVNAMSDDLEFLEEKEKSVGELMDNFARLMARLRSSDGCPWDLKQTPMSLTKHLLEEAYEAVHAVEREDWEHLSEELGDLLLQIVFQARIAEENGRFDLADVIKGISEKIERRHPHIFGDVKVDSAEDVASNWDMIKREEKEKRGVDRVCAPLWLPALMAAFKLQGEAARIGFDWESAEGVFEKIAEETKEVADSRLKGGESVEKEIGDLLFSVVNLSRHLGVDPERALRKSCEEFARRLDVMEKEARKKGGSLSGMTLRELDELWENAKKESPKEED